jgi:hypothetical protein
VNNSEKVFARTLFRLKIHVASGQEFENLFSNIMMKKHPNFRPVRVQGAIGDRKNDGYIREEGRYFQVFSPEEINSTTRAKAEKKAIDDFEGLYKLWNCDGREVKEYVFVLNDKFNGAYTEINDAIDQISIRYPSLEKASLFLASHLEDVLFSLDNDLISFFVGPIPNAENIDLIDYSDLNKIIEHIMKRKKPLNPSQTLVVPDFSEKISFNQLSISVQSLLVSASFQTGILDKYFEANSEHIRQDLRDFVNAKYEECTQNVGEAITLEDGCKDIVFFQLLDDLSPLNKEFTDQQRSSLQNAVLVLMSYFFETCDIFEEPTEVE